MLLNRRLNSELPTITMIQDHQFIRLISGNDIDQIFTRHTADKSHRRTEDTQERIEYDRPLIPDTVAEYPFPVINDLRNVPSFHFAIRISRDSKDRPFFP